ncbi:MAG: tetratricopeptide repeat protein [Deltaproteobacteria bacterium]|nr:tetratricopeptide repeat protein [Deltaproteobacteria bacterium]
MSTTTKFLFVSALFMAVAILPFQGMAQNGEGQPEAGEEQVNDLKALYDHGVILYQQEKYAEAAQAFRELVAQSPRFQFYFNIGECEYLRKRYDLALEAFETYIDKGGEKISAEDRAHAEAVIQESAAVTGRLDVTGEDSCELWVDGEFRGKVPLPKLIPLMPGEHTVACMNNGEQIAEKPVSVLEGEIVAIAFSVSNEAKPAEPVVAADIDSNAAFGTDESASAESVAENVGSPSVERKKTPLKTTGLVITGIGSATLVASLIAGNFALSKSDRLAQNCDNEKLCEDSNKDLYEDADTLTKATNILLATGVVLTVAGVVMALIGRKKRESREKIAVKTTPLIGEDVHGIVIQGSF